MGTHFIVNEDELARLASKLGVKNPIYVQGAATRGNTHGRYHGLRRYTVKNKLLPTKHHQITLACDTPVERLVETLIHEVVHARQEERTSRKTSTHKRYAVKAEAMEAEVRAKKGRLNDWDRYWTSAIEVEAREVAAKLKSQFPTLLAPRPLKEYVVVDKHSDRPTTYLVKGARSPQAAAAKVASYRFGDSRLASEFRVNVRKPAHGELLDARVIRWRPAR